MSFQEVSKLSVVFQVGEEELANYVKDAFMGADSDLKVGIALTLPSVRNVEGVVTSMPDYVRSWLISVSLSPIVVRQPEISDITVNLLIEGDLIQNHRFSYSREKVPYISLLEKTFNFTINEIDEFRELLREASNRYGGEIEITFSGEALAHILFMKVWLPFSTTRYPLVKVLHVDYVSSKWTDVDGKPVTRLKVGDTAYVQFKIENPTRVHSIYENVTINIFREASDEPILTNSKEVAVAPNSVSTYFFPFVPVEQDIYFYNLVAVEGFRLNKDSSAKLYIETR